MTNGEHEVVVVTGASGGVGRAVAHAFARRGTRIALLARGEDGLGDAAREVNDLGGHALVIPTDVTDAAAVEAAAAQAEDELGPIDVWVNDAMATVFAEFVDIDADEFRRATEVTYLGTVHGTMAALRRMVPRDHGTVVQVGSALAYRAIPLQSAYCGAKFAIRGFTDSVRTELLHDKSRVWISMVQLPAVNTPQFNWCRTKLPDHPMPVPPIYQPEVPAEIGVLGGPSPSPRGVLRSQRGRRDPGQQARSRNRRPLPGEDGVHVSADRRHVRSRRPSQQPLRAAAAPLAATHGMFDDKAKTRSIQAWLATHRAIAVGAVVGTAAAATGAWHAARS